MLVSSVGPGLLILNCVLACLLACELPCFVCLARKLHKGTKNIAIELAVFAFCG